MSERPASRADFSDVTDGTSAIERGRAIKERYEALGYSYAEFERLTRIGRKLLYRAFEGGSNDTSYDAIERHLDRLEARAAGKPTEETEVMTRPVGDPGDDLVEVSIEGNFGVRAVVKGPVRDKTEIADLVAQIVAAINKPPAENG